LKFPIDLKDGSFDRTNALIGGFVLLFSFIVYRLTLAPTISFWDCGEFLACSTILGIPHPPGSPLFIVLGRIFSILPLASDITYRINLISILSSAFNVLFGYLIVVRIIRFWYQDTDFTGWKRIITYLGGVTGAFFMAFGATNWSNAVEAEVYGLAMMIMNIIFWLALQYYEQRGTTKADRIVMLATYLAMLAVALHLTTFLVMPIAAIFFILKKDAPSRAWIAICLFFVAELASIILLSNGRGGLPAFILLTLIFLTVVAIMVYRYINWPILIAIGAYSMIMSGFYQFLFGVIGGLVILMVVAHYARESNWKTAIILLFLAVIGMSFNLFSPIRSSQKPRIDENMTSRSFKTFVDFLDRKQYGKESMVGRMFERRATWENQFGRHANMGYWSYFETQYGSPKVFGLLFLIMLFGVVFTIRKKLEIGLPFLIFLLLASAGLILYMNFADGIKYNERTGDAYMEVRDRDYFFTPAFIFFGLAIGLGVAAIMESVRQFTSQGKYTRFQKPALAVLSLMVLLPSMALSHNYFRNDRSNNYFPYIYSYNMLSSCDKDAILFTSGDNDTFPLWALQEVYNFRKDVRIVNLSLLNTDWYVAQMKNTFKVPISLEDDQILWDTYDYEGQEITRPKKPFNDRARKRLAYMIPAPFENRIVKVQDMLVDDIVLTNNWKYPICFSTPPYAESPLKLRDFTISSGLIYKMVKQPPERSIDADTGYRLYTEVYRYDGLNNYSIARDENSSGVMQPLGYNALRIYDDLNRNGQVEKAEQLLRLMIDKYPEFLQSYMTLSQAYKKRGDTAAANDIMEKMEKAEQALYDNNPENLMYMQDLGLAKYYRGKTQEGLDLLWEAFRANPNSNYGYQKLIQVLYELRRTNDIVRATQMYSEYKINRADPIVQQIMQQMQMTAPPAPVQTEEP
jgi:hypothetical protein